MHTFSLLALLSRWIQNLFSDGFILLYRSHCCKLRVLIPLFYSLLTRIWVFYLLWNLKQLFRYLANLFLVLFILLFNLIIFLAILFSLLLYCLFKSPFLFPLSLLILYFLSLLFQEVDEHGSVLRHFREVLFLEVSEIHFFTDVIIADIDFGKGDIEGSIG